MGKAFVLLIGSEATLLVPPFDMTDPHQAKLQPILLPETAAGLALLQSLCKAAPETSLIISADFPSIGLQRDVLPPVSHGDRKKLIARRLQQQTSHGFCYAVTQQDRHLLLATLPNEPRLKFWLDATAHLPNPSSGLSLIALELAHLGQRMALPDKPAWQLLTIVNRISGIRQIVMHKGDVVLTRFTAMPTDLSQLPILMRTAITTTQSYLQRLGLEDPTQLHITVIAAPELATALQNDDEAHHLRLVTPADAATQLQLPYASPAEDGFGDVLLAGFMAEYGLKWPQPKGASTQPKLQPKIESYLRPITLSMWIMLAMILAWQLPQSFMRYIELRKLHSEISTLERDYHQRYQQVATQIAPLEAMRREAVQQALFQSPEISPQPLITKIAATLSGSVPLDGLTWQLRSNQKIEQLELRGDALKSTTENALVTAFPADRVSQLQEDDDMHSLRLERDVP